MRKRLFIAMILILGCASPYYVPYSTVKDHPCILTAQSEEELETCVGKSGTSPSYYPRVPMGYYRPNPQTQMDNRPTWFYRAGDFLLDANFKRTMPCYDGGSFVYCP